MILAGDVGGTKVRLALFDPQKEEREFTDEQKFASRDFANFTDLLKKYLEGHQGKQIKCAGFGIAGPVNNDVCKAMNLPWVISAREIEKGLKIPKVYLTNDLLANAWGLRCLAHEEFFTVNRGEAGTGNQALVSAGTGLGEAGLYWDGKSHQPFPSEGGHCDFAPTTEEEIVLWRYLKEQFKHVSYERVLSGAGLFQIYRFLVDSKREKESPFISPISGEKEPQRIITEKAASGECRACAHACRIFTSIYGSAAGNTALKFLAVGGVFLGGGIAPHLLSFFQDERFIEAFISKGRLSSLLSKIPIKIVLNEKTALLGAARYAKEKTKTL